MKRQTTQFLLVIGSICGLDLPAQPLLTEATSIPAFGHSENHNIHSCFPVPVLATSGTGNVWTIDNAVWGGGQIYSLYYAPSTSPFAATYPDMTMTAYAESNTFGTAWWHYRSSPTAAEFIGAGGTPHPMPEVLCEFPLAYGAEFTTTYQEPGGQPVTRTSMYVASGEIVAYWGTIPNVVMFSINNGAYFRFFRAENMLFPMGRYIPGSVLEIDRVMIFNSIDEEALPRLGLWPVPATEVVHVTLPDNGQSQLVVRDASGRAVRTETALSSTHTIELEGLATGTYTVEATFPTGMRAVGRFMALR